MRFVLPGPPLTRLPAGAPLKGSHPLPILLGFLGAGLLCAAKRTIGSSGQKPIIKGSHRKVVTPAKRRYSLGVNPNFFLNTRLKYDKFPNPQLSATASTVSSLPRSMAAASFNRRSFKNVVKLCAVIALNHRMKWLALHPQAAAARSIEISSR